MSKLDGFQLNIDYFSSSNGRLLNLLNGTDSIIPFSCTFFALNIVQCKDKGYAYSEIKSLAITKLPTQLRKFSIHHPVKYNK